MELDVNLQDAIYHAVRRYPGGVEALAPRMGLKPASLRHKVSPTYPTAHLSPDELVQIITFCGTEPLHALCREVEHVAMPLPSAESACSVDIAAAMLEAGEFFVTASQAVKDNDVDSAEMRDALREFLEVSGALGKVMSHLQAMHERARVPPAQRKVRG